VQSCARAGHVVLVASFRIHPRRERCTSREYWTGPCSEQNPGNSGSSRMASTLAAGNLARTGDLRGSSGIWERCANAKPNLKLHQSTCSRLLQTRAI
jgi:hypothetical protein